MFFVDRQDALFLVDGGTACIQGIASDNYKLFFSAANPPRVYVRSVP